jgi:endonuclease I
MNRFVIRFGLAFVVAAVIAGAGAVGVHADAYDPPSNYYNAATGTGSTLLTQLRTIISTGFVARNYGASKYSPAITDIDPNNASNVLLIYNRDSVTKTWNGGDIWNREHIWPTSLLGVSSPSDSYTGPSSDLFNLRPCNPSINSSRSNNPYGTTSSSGSYGYQTSGYWYPGNADIGDAARTIFYMATRYSNLTVINGNPGTYQMGDLQALLKWNYTDIPDDFERRRNQAIYSSALNPSYYQGNRNPYIDHPEWVWSVFGDNANDSKLYVGSNPSADGSSGQTVNLGRVMQGQSPYLQQSVTLQKSGTDPTYFQVTPSSNASSSITGRYNAFTYGSANRAMTVGLNVNGTTLGTQTGTVTIDNIDITNQGTGTGALDGNDVVTLSAAVVARREINASPVTLGNAYVGATLAGSSSLSTNGSDDQRTRVTVDLSGSVDANGARVSSGQGSSFQTEAATGTRTVSATFTSAGNKNGAATVGVRTAENGGLGLTGEGAYTPVSIAYTATVFDHANASFSASLDMNELTLDFGVLTRGADPVLQLANIFNLVTTPGFTAALQVGNAIPVTGDTADLVVLGGGGVVPAGGTAASLFAAFNPTSVGVFDATWSVPFSESAYLGAQSGSLILHLLAEVLPDLILGDMNNDGLLDFDDINPFSLALNDPAAYQTAFPGLDAAARGDINHDGQLDFDDINPFANLLNTPAATALVYAAIPEPGGILIFGVGIFGVMCRRRRGC